ncbi:LapA family protein [Sphingomonas sp. BT-65]|uniref:LapA family protein n=1 Tax=Sphingomonas sp. BT-65 TaxID=2989821 RepID=UPI00223591A7|nr:LapA family protein [Sphingomonas sp. BT-65]MCW4460573.1 LapA family protein [Sphingomonas sp. BT-65]
MQFLKALFWFLILGLVAAFAVTNWHPVEIQLWSGLVADVNLPFLLFVVFLAGFLPMLLLFHTVRWRLRQRIGMLERTVEEMRNLHAASPAASGMPIQPDPGLEPAETPAAPPLVAP